MVGVELVVDRMVGIWKVSQNQPEANRSGRVSGLHSAGDISSIAMARLIKEYMSAAP